MSSAEEVEEGYPLAPFHTGAAGEDAPEDDSLLHAAPIRGGSSKRRGRIGPLGKLRTKFQSLRPLVRVLVVFAAGLLPLWYLASRFWEDIAWLVGLHRPPGPYRGQRGGKAWGVQLPPLEGPIENWNSKADEVKEAFAHAYSGYETYAFPADELLPLTKGRINP